MSADDDKKRTFRQELLLASMLVSAGVLIAGLSIAEINPMTPVETRSSRLMFSGSRS